MPTVHISSLLQSATVLCYMTALTRHITALFRTEQSVHVGATGHNFLVFHEPNEQGTHERNNHLALRADVLIHN
jgi:hypothetical protein